MDLLRRQMGGSSGGRTYDLATLRPTTYWGRSDLTITLRTGILREGVGGLLPIAYYLLPTCDLRSTT